jgi:pyridoxal phosphate enzyme (YggS family)
MTIRDNIADLQQRIALAARRAGRNPAEIQLVAVSKTHAPEKVAEAAEMGLRDFGENRVEEAAPKMTALAGAGLRWHMIGHIQGRKAKDVVRAGFALVHSVDSGKLAERLSRLSVAAGRVLPVLLECNVSGEASKEGFAARLDEDWAARLPDFAAVLALPGLRVQGLMTMAPLGPDPEAARPIFGRLRELRDYLRIQLPQSDWRELSMGMTDDFEPAIAEGSTIVRVGRAIFGERAPRA